MFGQRFKADGVVVDEVVVEPVVGDHQVQHAVEEGDIAAWFDGQEQVAGAGDRGDARIDDDDLGAVFPGLPHVVGGDGRAFGDVGAANPDHFCAQNIVPGIGGTIYAERFFVASGGANHA